MNPPERWTSLEIDAAEPPPLAPPEPGRHVVVFTATPTVRSGGWSARAAVEICRGWGAAGARIVLADLALEEPVLHGAAGLDNLEGVSDALLFGTSFQRLGQPLSDGLYLVTAGTAVPDGEALRSHPRWRDFVEGFREADAVLALYVPDDAPGLDVLLGMADGVIALCTEDETGDPSLAAGPPVLAALGPERVREEDLGGDAGGRDSLGLADPGSEPDEAPAREAPVEAPVEADAVVADVGETAAEEQVAAEEEVAAEDPGDAERGSEAGVEAEPEARSDGPEGSDGVADFLEELDVAPVDPEMAVAAEAAALEDEEEELPDPMATPASDPLASEAGDGEPAPTLDEILAGEDVADAAPAGEGPGPTPAPQPPESPAEPEFASSASGGRKGPSPALLVLLLVVVVAALVAAFLGIVEIPGVTPSAAGVEEAGAAEVRGGASPAPSPGTDDGTGGEESPVSAEANPLLSHVLAIGSFRDLATALERARAIELAAPTVRLIVAPVEVDGDAYFRLLAGPTSTAEELEILRDRLVPALGGRVEGITREARLAYLMGTAPRQPLAERHRDVLSRLGVPAYILRVTGSDGEYRYRVYAGAYANPAEARYLAAVLRENGIEGAPLTERRGVWPE